MSSCFIVCTETISIRRPYHIGSIDKVGIVLAINIAILTLAGVSDTGLAALQDSFSLAEELSQSFESCALGFNVTRVRVGHHVETAHGLTVPAIDAETIQTPMVVVVAAIGAKTPEALEMALKQDVISNTGALLRKWHAEGAIIAAACTGTFVLAESGLLDGKTSTTSWWLGPYFRSRYPKVKLADELMVYNAGTIVTAGAVLAHFDLALWLIRQSSPIVAAQTARYLVTESRVFQSGYVIPDHLRHNDPIVQGFEKWSRQNLTNGFSLQSASRMIGTSPRTLSRKLQRVVGKAPLAYFQDLRVERAVHLLQTTNESVDEIAALVGYSNRVTLCALLRRRLGRSVSEIRSFAP